MVVTLRQCSERQVVPVEFEEFRKTKGIKMHKPRVKEKKPMPTVLTKKEHNKRAPTTQLSVDFPRQNEVICSPQYTLRVSAPDGVKKVEVAIDGGEWQRCRDSVGHWWYDWTGYEDGEHEIVTRVETQKGRLITSEPHEFFVDFQPKPSKK